MNYYLGCGFIVIKYLLFSCLIWSSTMAQPLHTFLVESEKAECWVVPVAFGLLADVAVVDDRDSTQSQSKIRANFGL